jgi:hypothetical protein
LKKLPMAKTVQATSIVTAAAIPNTSNGRRN